MFGIELLGAVPLVVVACVTVLLFTFILSVDSQLGDRRTKAHELRMAKLERRTNHDDRELKLAQEESKQARERRRAEQARENRVARQLKREKMNARIAENDRTNKPNDPETSLVTDGGVKYHRKTLTEIHPLIATATDRETETAPSLDAAERNRRVKENVEGVEASWQTETGREVPIPDRIQRKLERLDTDK